MMKHSLRIFKRLTDFHIQYILTHCLRFYFHCKLQLPLKTRKQKAEKQHSDIIANDFSLALPETKFSCSGDYTEINFAFYDSETLNIFNFFIFFFLSSLEVLVLLPFAEKWLSYEAIITTSHLHEEK